MDLPAPTPKPLLVEGKLLFCQKRSGEAPEAACVWGERRLRHVLSLGVAGWRKEPSSQQISPPPQ